MKRLLQPLHSQQHGGVLASDHEQQGRRQQQQQQRCLLDLLGGVAPLREGLLRTLLERMVTCAQVPPADTTPSCTTSAWMLQPGLK